MPTEAELVDALAAASAAHHEYESRFLAGAHDDQWSGWYAAYLLGRLGDFMAPTRLARLLADVEIGDGWSQRAASAVRDSAG